MQFDIQEFTQKVLQSVNMKDLAELSQNLLKKVNEVGTDLQKKFFTIEKVNDLANSKYKEWLDSFSQTTDFKVLVSKALETKYVKEILDTEMNELKDLSDASFDALKKILQEVSFEKFAHNQFIEWIEKSFSSNGNKLNLNEIMVKAYDVKPLQNFVNSTLNTINDMNHSGLETISKFLNIQKIGDISVEWSESLSKSKDVNDFFDNVFNSKKYKELSDAQINYFNDCNQTSYQAIKSISEKLNSNIQQLTDSYFKKTNVEIVKEKATQKAAAANTGK